MRRGLGYNLEAPHYFKSWSQEREEDYQCREVLWKQGGDYFKSFKAAEKAKSGTRSARWL